MIKSKRNANEPKPLPKRVVRIIDRVQSGETLCRAYRPRTIGGGDDVLMWWFEPSGIECAAISARQAVESGKLAPCDAGLFSDGNSQSFIAASQQ